MELRELKSFVTAAKLRSISKAAKELNIGQPTVTTHIKKLERAFSEDFSSTLYSILANTYL